MHDPKHDPSARIPDDKIKTRKQLSKFSTGSLTDEDVTTVGKIVYALQLKFRNRYANETNLAQLEDEAMTKLAEAGFLAKVDPTPTLTGDPPIVEIIGKVGNLGFQKPHDHERQYWDVAKAEERGEAFLGEKEIIDSTPIKKRHKNASKNPD